MKYGYDPKPPLGRSCYLAQPTEHIIEEMGTTASVL